MADNNEEIPDYVKRLFERLNKLKTGEGKRKPTKDSIIKNLRQAFKEAYGYSPSGNKYSVKGSKFGRFFGKAVNSVKRSRDLREFIRTITKNLPKEDQFFKENISYIVEDFKDDTRKRREQTRKQNKKWKEEKKRERREEQERVFGNEEFGSKFKGAFWKWYNGNEGNYFSKEAVEGGKKWINENVEEFSILKNKTLGGEKVNWSKIRKELLEGKTGEGREKALETLEYIKQYVKDIVKEEKKKNKEDTNKQKEEEKSNKTARQFGAKLFHLSSKYINQLGQAFYYSNVNNSLEGNFAGIMKGYFSPYTTGGAVANEAVNFEKARNMYHLTGFHQNAPLLAMLGLGPNATLEEAKNAIKNTGWSKSRKLAFSSLLGIEQNNISDNNSWGERLFAGGMNAIDLALGLGLTALVANSLGKTAIGATLMKGLGYAVKGSGLFLGGTALGYGTGKLTELAMNKWGGTKSNKGDEYGRLIGSALGTIAGGIAGTFAGGHTIAGALAGGSLLGSLGTLAGHNIYNWLGYSDEEKNAEQTQYQTDDKVANVTIMVDEFLAKAKMTEISEQTFNRKWDEKHLSGEI